MLAQFAKGAAGLWLLQQGLIEPPRRRIFPVGIDLKRRTAKARLVGGPRNGRVLTEIDVDELGRPLLVNYEIDIPRAVPSEAQYVRKDSILLEPRFTVDTYRVPFGERAVDGFINLWYQHPAADFAWREWDIA
jgi:hypothetical protein